MDVGEGFGVAVGCGVFVGDWMSGTGVFVAVGGREVAVLGIGVGEAGSGVRVAEAGFPSPAVWVAEGVPGGESSAVCEGEFSDSLPVFPTV